MKKHILNRPMFRQVKSPAYGTGIASNLVSNEERQRYNYGGRVGLYRGRGIGYNPAMYLPSDSDEIGRRNIYEQGNIEDYLPTIPVSEFVVDQEDFQEQEWNPKIKVPPKKRGWEDREAPGGEHPLYGKYETSEVPSRSSEEIIADETIRQRNQLGGKDLTEFREQETETIDVDPFAFLDKNIEEKKKLAKGNALMKAAAAAVKWGGAPTAEKRAAAISEGLTGFGDEASKATAAAMDLKDRAKILAATQGMKDEAAYARQELKGEQAMEKQKELINYYDRKLEGVDPNASLEEAYQSVTKDTGGKDYYSRSIALQEVLQGKGLNVGVQLADTTNDSVVKKIQDGVIVIDANTGRYFQKKGAQLIPTSRKEIFATLEKS
jgi:hypothetical protein